MVKLLSAAVHLWMRYASSGEIYRANSQNIVRVPYFAFNILGSSSNKINHVRKQDPTNNNGGEALQPTLSFCLPAACGIDKVTIWRFVCAVL